MDIGEMRVERGEWRVESGEWREERAESREQRAAEKRKNRSKGIESSRTAREARASLVASRRAWTIAGGLSHARSARALGRLRWEPLVHFLSVSLGACVKNRLPKNTSDKGFKNGAKIAPDRLPGTSWHSFWASWALLGLISGLLGPPGGHFGSPGSHFGPLLALLGLSWRSWGPPGTPKWLQNGSQNGSQMAPGRPPGREPALGDLILRKTHWHAHGSRVFETWLSWNGKREKRKSVKHCRQGESSESRKNSKRGSARTT